MKTSKKVNKWFLIGMLSTWLFFAMYTNASRNPPFYKRVFGKCKLWQEKGRILSITTDSNLKIQIQFDRNDNAQMVTFSESPTRDIIKLECNSPDMIQVIVQNDKGKIHKDSNFDGRFDDDLP